MKKLHILTGVAACAASLFAATPKIIFDTDMVEDYDDVGAMAVLHAMADAGKCEILAMASYPTYSLRTFRQDYAVMKDDPLAPMYNRAIMGLYAPGSTFKMVTAAAALEEGIITPNTKITDLGIYTFWED